MFGIGADRQVAWNVLREAQIVVTCGEAFAVEHLANDRGKAHSVKLGWRLVGAAEGERILAQVHRAGDRIDELGGKALHHRIFGGLDPVDEKLGRGEDIAQVMADLGDALAQLREPFALAQRCGQLLLHHLKSLA